MAQSNNKGVNIYAAEIASWREGKGFFTPCNLDEPEPVIVKLALVHEEVSEAISAVRQDPPDVENFCEELADAFIRLLDLTGTMEIDIEAEIDKKMAKNHNRPHLHGKRA